MINVEIINIGSDKKVFSKLLFYFLLFKRMNYSTNLLVLILSAAVGFFYMQNKKNKQRLRILNREVLRQEEQINKLYLQINTSKSMESSSRYVKEDNDGYVDDSYYEDEDMGEYNMYEAEAEAEAEAEDEAETEDEAEAEAEAETETEATGMIEMGQFGIISSFMPLIGQSIGPLISNLNSRVEEVASTSSGGYEDSSSSSDDTLSVDFNNISEDEDEDEEEEEDDDEEEEDEDEDEEDVISERLVNVSVGDKTLNVISIEERIEDVEVITMEDRCSEEKAVIEKFDDNVDSSTCVWVMKRGDKKGMMCNKKTKDKLIYCPKHVK